MVEPRFEFALAGGRGGDVHGGLAAAEDDEGLFGGQGGCVQGGVGGVGFEELEVPRRDQLGGFVLGGGEEVGTVGGGLDVGYLHAVFVGGEGVEQLAGLGW